MEPYTLPKAGGFTREIDAAAVSLYTIRSSDNSCACAITNYGARIVSLLVPDAAGKPIDVVLGYNDLDGYLKQPEEYMGAVVGRCANRIAAGLFVLNGETVILPTNDGPNTLHGGPKGLHTRVWNVLKHTDSMLVLTYRSPDGEEGMPGNLDIEIVYEWTDTCTLSMRYHAITDKPTLVNLSNHSYFNLSGEGADTILDHDLRIQANAITAVNHGLIPTGALVNVMNTPFDFRTAHPIGTNIEADSEQLQIGKGYDHNFVLIEDAGPTILKSPRTGIQLGVKTDRPGLQVYSGNFLDGSRTGKTGRPYGYRSAVALEPQDFPDAIHHPQFPTVVIRPGHAYYSVSEYQFSAS